MSHLDKCRILAFHNDKTHRKVGLARCFDTVAGFARTSSGVALERGHPTNIPSILQPEAPPCGMRTGNVSAAQASPHWGIHHRGSATGNPGRAR